MLLFITGGAGFIGSTLVKKAILEHGIRVVNIDKLTYAGNLKSLQILDSDPLYKFEKVDICDASALNMIFLKYRPDGVIHLAAESHVDRSIDAPEAFIQTNIFGTYQLLVASHNHFKSLEFEKKSSFRFIHVSTDEVFGSILDGKLFNENSSYDPSSPYSASKAASDHLVRAWYRTYGLPTIVTNCSNNYGPFHFPEKFIPLMILNGIEGKPMPLYGSGENIRDWLYVEDHAEALLEVFGRGKIGDTYTIGGRNERTNRTIIEAICDLLDEYIPSSKFESYRELIVQVNDRPGHDLRYAIDPSKIEQDLGWKAKTPLSKGLRKTVEWYLENQWWYKSTQQFYARERLGLQA